MSTTLTICDPIDAAMEYIDFVDDHDSATYVYQPILGTINSACVNLAAKFIYDERKAAENGGIDAFQAVRDAAQAEHRDELSFDGSANNDTPTTMEQFQALRYVAEDFASRVMQRYQMPDAFRAGVDSWAGTITYKSRPNPNRVDRFNLGASALSEALGESDEERIAAEQKAERRQAERIATISNELQEFFVTYTGRGGYEYLPGNQKGLVVGAVTKALNNRIQFIKNYRIEHMAGDVHVIKQALKSLDHHIAGLLTDNPELMRYVTL